jgi:hypothetical protein
MACSTVAPSKPVEFLTNERWSSFNSKGRKLWPSEHLPDSSFAVSIGGFCLSASFIKYTAKGWRFGRPARPALREASCLS